MTSNFGNWDDQTLDLAIRAFTEGLDAEGTARLQRTTSANDLQSFEHSLAAIHWSNSGDVCTPPDEAMKRLQREAELWLGSPHQDMPKRIRNQAPSEVKPLRAPWLMMAGWAVAAALCILLFVQQGGSAWGPSPEEGMDALVAQATDLQRIQWSATEDPLAAGAVGEVVWSDEFQEGYMVFRGLAPNNPAEAQFQLWVFDPSRVDWDTAPVDGGVFDVVEGEEVVIPIRTALPVRDVALFAITMEEPGGVVVSKREHLLLTAKQS